MKGYTCLEQSKKLAEFLPPESADMHYVLIDTDKNKYDAGFGKYIGILQHYPCWSLAALLDVLPRETRLLKSATDDIFYHTDCPKGNVDEWFDNPVDACYEMIIKLHELKML